MGTLTAFVAGATGYTGREVVAELRRRGVATHAHVRPGASSLATWQARFDAIGAVVDRTEWEPGAIAATLARIQPDYVFALLGTTRVRATREGLDDPYEKVDYGLTDQLRNGAASCASRPRFVYLSSLGATEMTRNKYLEVRGRLEREIKEGTLPYLIARPALVSGTDREESRPRERLIAAIADGAFGALAWVGATGFRASYGTLTGTELAAGMVELALFDRYGAGTFEVRALRDAARRSPKA